MKKIDYEEEMRIMKKISEETDNIEIPESISPGNMMKKLRNMKQCRVNEMETDKNNIDGNQKPVSKRHRKLYRGMVAGIVAVAAACLAIFIAGPISENGINTKKSAKKTSDIDNILKKSENDIMESAGSREEITGWIELRVSDYMKDYYERDWENDKSSAGIWNEAATSNELFGNDDVDSAPENNGDFTSSEDMVQGESNDYYKNNDQVEGVTEADYTITDGKYIYSINKDTNLINIMSANKEKVEKTASIDFLQDIGFNKDSDGRYRNMEKSIGINDCEMYVNKSMNKLIVVFNLEEYELDTVENMKMNTTCIDLSYGCISTQYSYIVQYDISDIGKPELEAYNKVEGRLESSRMVNNYIYMGSMKNIDLSVNTDETYDEALERVKENAIPKINDKEMEYDCIYIGEGEDEDNSFQVMTAYEIGADTLECKDSKALLGKSGFMYASGNNIYLIASEYKSENKNNSEYIWCESEISRFSYKDGEIEACAKGSIEGDVLGQFSVDEYNGYLRVVSTIERRRYATIGSDGYMEEYLNEEEENFEEEDVGTQNALYILNMDMSVNSVITGIAKDESIYSARFMGDYGYFVTFEQTDPLFTVDLSDPDNPVITSELKITGFSEYLHMWSDNLMIGVGSEADNWGSVTGFKISLFDISDKSDVKEIGREVIDDAYFSSYDYKTMMVAPEKNLLGMEIYDNLYWSKAIPPRYVLFYVTEDGAEEIFQYRCEDEEIINTFVERYYNQYYNDAEGDEYIEKNEMDADKEEIRDSVMQSFRYRALYIGDYLYIITEDAGIQSVNLTDFSLGEFVKFD